MTFFGTRRARQTRVFRPTQSLWDRMSDALHDYRFIKLLLIGIASILLLLGAMQSWKTRFPYRVGQNVPDGVLARVKFQVENAHETQRARDDAEDAAPLVFTQNKEILDTLTATFRIQLSDVANAESVTDLEPAVIAGFGLDPDDPKEFETFRSSLTGTAAVGQRVEQLQLEFSQWISEIRPVGIVDPGVPKQLGIVHPDETPVEVVSDDGRLLNFSVLTDLILKDQLRDTGVLGKAWREHPDLALIRPWIESWVTANLRGQLKYDESRTSLRRQEAAAETEPKFDYYREDSVLVPAGKQITPEHRLLLEHEYNAYEAETTLQERLARTLGTFLLLVAMVVLIGYSIARSHRELLDDAWQLIVYAGLCVMAVAAGRLLSIDPWRAEIIPVMAVVIVVAIVHSQSLAVLTGFCLSVLVAFGTLERLDHFVALFTLCVTVAVPLREVSSRSTLIKIGFVAAITGFLAVWGLHLLQTHSVDSAWSNPAVLTHSLKLAGWSLVCCYLVAGSLPFIEKAFGIVTDISLLELTDVSHPLLQELARRAPGTYNHSMSVATIGEAAADAIGANGLLVRVGAYFHDIGKVLKPEYFIENMTEGQSNPHDNLTPAMSALIIIGHVKDGIELAEQHNLPQKLVNFIEQHHGTTLVEYFFHAATARLDDDHRTDADESTFRYPGPRPQSRETGVMMLADAVESASRTLSEPTPKRIQSLVRDITLKRLLDGQFDACGLTMSDLRIVQESIVKTLLAVHHGRIKYPDQKTA